MGDLSVSQHTPQAAIELTAECEKANNTINNL